MNIKLTTHLLLVLRLRMSGAVPLHHICTFMVQAGTNLLSGTFVGEFFIIFKKER